MRLPRIIHSRPDGGVTVVSPTPELIVSFLRWGEARAHVWFGDVRTSSGDVMDLTTAETRALAFVLDRAVPGGATYRAAYMDARVTTEAALLAAEAAADPRVEVGEDIVDPILGPGLRWPDGSTITRRFRDCYRRVRGGLPRVDMALARAQRLREILFERDRRLHEVAWRGWLAEYIGTSADVADITAQAAWLSTMSSLVEADLTVLTTPEALAIYAPTWTPAHARVLEVA